mmetsp:Transcript_106301/g.317671  ORF Transcript_106301/g.317671 Transcript_106301/m.317671 type:complete len:347 (-) Transcript_106301:13-1053(-)
MHAGLAGARGFRRAEAVGPELQRGQVVRGHGVRGKARGRTAGAQGGTAGARAALQSACWRGSGWGQRWQQATGVCAWKAPLALLVLIQKLKGDGLLPVPRCPGREVALGGDKDRGDGPSAVGVMPRLVSSSRIFGAMQCPWPKAETSRRGWLTAVTAACCACSTAPAGGSPAIARHGAMRVAVCPGAAGSEDQLQLSPGLGRRRRGEFAGGRRRGGGRLSPGRPELLRAAAAGPSGAGSAAGDRPCLPGGEAAAWDVQSGRRRRRRSTGRPTLAVAGCAAGGLRRRWRGLHRSAACWPAAADPQEAVPQPPGALLGLAAGGASHARVRCLFADLLLHRVPFPPSPA